MPFFFFLLIFIIKNDFFCVCACVMGKYTILFWQVWRHYVLTFHFTRVPECGDKAIWPPVTPIRHFYCIECFMSSRKHIFLYSFLPSKIILSFQTKISKHHERKWSLNKKRFYFSTLRVYIFFLFINQKEQDSKIS